VAVAHLAPRTSGMGEATGKENILAV